MAFSAHAIRESDKAKVVLSLDEGHIKIDAEGAKQQVVLENQYIYGLDWSKEEKKLEIHFCETLEQRPSGSENKTISDFRNSGKTVWQRAVRVFILEDNGDEEFVSQLRQRVLPSREPETRVFVVLNPFAGGRRAVTEWQEIVQPMLFKAGFSASNMSVTHTLPKGETRLLAEQLGLRILQGSEPAIVICMGGDGTIHEVVNGLSDAFERRAHDGQSPPSFFLGIVPSGSGNALSLSLDIQSPEHAALKIIKGRTQPLRLMDVATGYVTSDQEKWYEAVKYDKERRTRILVVMSWGFHAQIVSKSRYLRYFMGNQRFSLVAQILFLFLSQYTGELVMRGAKRYEPRNKAFLEEQSEIVIGEDQFTYFLISKQHSLERGFKIAPYASPSSPEMDVVMMRRASKEQLKAATIKVIQGGRHVDEAGDIVEYYKTSELLLRVKEQAELCLDGEIHSLAAKGVVRIKMIGPASGEPDFETFV